MSRTEYGSIVGSTDEMTGRSTDLTVYRNECGSKRGHTARQGKRRSIHSCNIFVGLLSPFFFPCGSRPSSSIRLLPRQIRPLPRQIRRCTSQSAAPLRFPIHCGPCASPSAAGCPSRHRRAPTAERPRARRRRRHHWSRSRPTRAGQVRGGRPGRPIRGGRPVRGSRHHHWTSGRPSCTSTRCIFPQHREHQAWFVSARLIDLEWCDSLGHCIIVSASNRSCK